VPEAYTLFLWVREMVRRHFITSRYAYRTATPRTAIYVKFLNCVRVLYDPMVGSTDSRFDTAETAYGCSSSVTGCTEPYSLTVGKRRGH
jgi:hypothetical protein